MLKTLNYKRTHSDLEDYFSKFRKHVIGNKQVFSSPIDGAQKITYADWTASGRLYQPIEQLLSYEIGPFVANTHTETTFTGCAMTHGYHKAQKIIKAHVNASENDVLITCGSGMTAVVNKFQRILGLKLHEKFQNSVEIPKKERPVVFCTHMEHHSNQTSWLETIADVVVVPAGADNLVDPQKFDDAIQDYLDRPLKIAAITSCSNVTGIVTPFHEIAEVIHRYDGLCFVDFACSAPYINIDMHPENQAQKLDAIFFSPHKFLGGPGAVGVLVFDKKMYTNNVPDHPGGGTVIWTNPWGEHQFLNDIEAREDGGTPPFLQTIKAALAIRLKEEMDVEKILTREAELLEIVWRGMDSIPNLHILAGEHRENRIGVVSFLIEDLHYNLCVKLLNDRFGVQTRGGCSCAGTYGHILLGVDKKRSDELAQKIDKGQIFYRPGWVRMSIHPTMTNEEVEFIIYAISEVAKNYKEWSKDYISDIQSTEFRHKNECLQSESDTAGWFNRSFA